MHAMWKPVLLACAVALASGCSSMGKKADGDAAIEDRGMGAVQEGAVSEGYGTGGMFQGMSIDDPASPLYQRVIYFEFDSSEVRAADRELLTNHAAYMAQNANVRVVLEGHADERGSREYNIALGQKRADSVKRMLTLLGAQDAQIETVSFGKEKPKNPGHDEASWAENRRDDLVYAGD